MNDFDSSHLRWTKNTDRAGNRYAFYSDEYFNENFDHKWAKKIPVNTVPALRAQVEDDRDKISVL